MRQGLCSHHPRFRVPSGFVPALCGAGDTPYGRGYEPTRPICGPFGILSSALKRWGPPRHKGLCSHHVHLWATPVFVFCFEALWTPRTAGVAYHQAPLWAPSDFHPHFEALGTP